MDFDKLKSLAKTAADKTKDGIVKANDMRNKANQETKISLPASNSFSSATSIRKTIDGNFYIGPFSENPTLFSFAGFNYDGSKVIEKTMTKGRTSQQGRTGSVLGGAALGTILAPGVGTMVGAMAGANRKKKGKMDSVSTTTSEEKPGKASILLRDLNTGEIKTIATKLTQAEANNVQMFFMN
ncbi:hypothetical protein [Streptococcus moroccensis]|uniref:Phage protein n=1 Tax=Streptococcus moroccensis TaxID=1451356 RepID=A0ABT9YNX9_9STRE|nr:hypothetical protein [Streptococcus moroccensis]MDQ0221694.1 hypothetical protein [Streptococcus moroccensis]